MNDVAFARLVHASVERLEHSQNGRIYHASNFSAVRHAVLAQAAPVIASATACATSMPSMAAE